MWSNFPLRCDILGAPNPDSNKLPSIPVIQVPTPRAPNELELPDELAWQRYRTSSTPKKNVVQLAPKSVSWRATRLLSMENFIPSGILYLIAGLLYAGSPFRSTGKRHYLSKVLNSQLAVEKLAKAFVVFTTAEAESYGNLVQECMGVPLMQISADEMDDSCFTWLQEVIQPFSIPVYEACLAFKRGSHLFNFASKPKEAVSFFQNFLHLAKTAPDGFPVLDEQKRRLDVDRGQETIRHAKIAEDFIFDYARAVKQFLRPNYFSWWLCLASQAIVHYELKTTHKCASNNLSQYLNYLQSLIELLDTSITNLSTTKSQFATVAHMQQLRETIILEFHLEAATALIDGASLLLLCKNNKESQKLMADSLNFVKKGLDWAQEFNKSDWEVCFRVAQAILHIRFGQIPEANAVIQASSKTARKHNAIKEVTKLISEIMKKKTPKESTKNRATRSIAQTLVFHPIDWTPYDWSSYLEPPTLS